MELLHKDRLQIASKLRELRRARNWSQVELSRQLHISQSHLSEIERGTGSLTAERFLLLLRLFNVSAIHFVSEPHDEGRQLQNALARSGASHLHESTHVLPSEQLDDVHAVVREALVEGSPRALTALAPVLVRHAERLNFFRLLADLDRLGLDRRLTWVIENTLVALRSLLEEPGSVSREWRRRVRGVEMYLARALEMMASRDQIRNRAEDPPDVLDMTIRSRRTLEEVRSSSSEISQRWGIVTSLQVEDFAQALRAARAGH